MTPQVKLILDATSKALEAMRTLDTLTNNEFGNIEHYTNYIKREVFTLRDLAMYQLTSQEKYEYYQNQR